MEGCQVLDAGPLATRTVAELLARHRGQMTTALLAWSRTPDLWLRRSAIICQVHAKAATDLELLYACIEPNLGERDFFVARRSAGRCAPTPGPTRTRWPATWRPTGTGWPR
jgi:3-methyladenine DNA glycosylase AlkD